MDNKGLLSFIKTLRSEHALIDEERKKLLRLIADLINESIKNTGKASIIAICTHNSRRSQLIEAWIIVVCQYYKLTKIKAYSGGTEATAFNIRMIVALRQVSFHLHTNGPRNNPNYTLQALKDSGQSHTMFSKVYDHPLNPREDFIAFMVCSQADQDCPIILGARHRISLPYLDPKEYDDTPMEDHAYQDKVKEIGREMLYLFERVY